MLVDLELNVIRYIILEVGNLRTPGKRAKSRVLLVP